jgi:hypothetical protein
MVFTLKAEIQTQDSKPTDRITHEFVAEDLHMVLDRMSEFLRGCGYIIGQLTEADEPAELATNPTADGGGSALEN